MANKRSATLYNLTLTDANTEYSQALPEDTKWFEFQCRTAADVRFAFTSGLVAGSVAPYITLKSGQSYDSGALYAASRPTLYCASGSAGVVVEIIAWT